MPQHPTRHGMAPHHSCCARQLANQKEQLIANFKDRDVRVMLGTIDVCNCNAPGYCPSCAQCARDRFDKSAAADALSGSFGFARLWRHREAALTHVGNSPTTPSLQRATAIRSPTFPTLRVESPALYVRVSVCTAAVMGTLHNGLAGTTTT